MEAQLSMIFCVCPLGALWRWSQSGIVTDVGIFDAVSTLTAKPAVAGSAATDRLISMATMIRPIHTLSSPYLGASHEMTK
jgi:hypothetical protein